LQEDYELYGKGIFALMRKRFPTKYFDALVYLAKAIELAQLAPSFRGIAASSRMAFDALRRAGTGTLARLE
jgi:hypothetical protein